MSFEKLRFSDSQIQQANNVDILNYATSQGLNIKRINDYSYKIDGYGGLYVNPIENRWNCFQKEGGGGPIQFIMFLHKKTWVESIKELLGLENQLTYLPIKRDINDHVANIEFVLPEKNDTYKHMAAYLTQTRKIDSSILSELIKENKIYEDIHRNCVFIGTDKEGHPKYANLRSTNTNVDAFKGDAKNSDKAFPFSIQGIDKELFVFESPVETLSYLTIEKQFNLQQFNHHVISLGGVGDRALENYLEMYPEINKITLCLNNDGAGRGGVERIKNKYNNYEIEERYPTHNDYNEDLKSLVRAKEIKERFPDIDWDKELQNRTLIEINQNDATKIIETKEPLGRFYYRDGRKMIGIDNSTGEACTKSFYTFDRLIHWQLVEEKGGELGHDDWEIEL
ncbi:MAG: topoisomerase [Firmicutes bacterium HGW-Firmicutes-7]|nr:MAG: topoisomerase [Firmicutes bacterium HGW-Firmicutes-7]